MDDILRQVIIGIIVGAILWFFKKLLNLLPKAIRLFSKLNKSVCYFYTSVIFLYVAILNIAFYCKTNNAINLYYFAACFSLFVTDFWDFINMRIKENFAKLHKHEPIINPIQEDKTRDQYTTM